MITKRRGERVVKWKLHPHRVCVLLDAVEFYANPENYHAISFLRDRPCGGFADDFGDEHGDDSYDRPMPGVEARKALRAWRDWPVDTGQQERLDR